MNTLERNHATAAETPVITTKLRGMIHISLSLAGVREKATWEKQCQKTQIKLRHFQAPRNGGDECGSIKRASHCDGALLVGEGVLSPDEQNPHAPLC